jgi:hypothetical protein
MFFHNEPRVEVDLSRMAYRYLRFGKVLIGGHHGHGAKPADLPLLMAVDRPAGLGRDGLPLRLHRPHPPRQR